MPWQSEADFVKTAGQSGHAGLPNKHIHVDTAKQPSVSEQTEGQLYSDIVAKLIDVEPRMCCPNCGARAHDIKDGGQVYTRDILESGGKTHKGDIPKCPIPGLDIPTMAYTVSPCGCRVSVEWAGAFAAELQSRLGGSKPAPIIGVTPKQREFKLNKLEADLARLYALQDKATGAQKEAVDYWIVVVADQIQRLCPGKHNQQPLPKKLEPEVIQWAVKNAHSQPTAQVTTTPYYPLLASQGGALPAGTPLYQSASGAMSTVPVYSGQKPAGHYAVPGHPNPTEQTDEHPNWSAWGYPPGYKMPKNLGVAARVAQDKLANTTANQADALALAIQMTQAGIMSATSVGKLVGVDLGKEKTQFVKGNVGKVHSVNVYVIHGEYVVRIETEAFEPVERKFGSLAACIAYAKQLNDNRHTNPILGAVAELLSRRLSEIQNAQKAANLTNTSGVPPFKTTKFTPSPNKVVLHGANAEETSVYAKAASSLDEMLGALGVPTIVPGQPAATQYTPADVKKILSYFTTHQGTIYGVVSQYLLPAGSATPTLTLLETVDEIANNLRQHTEKGMSLSALSKQFLTAWRQAIEIGKKLLPDVQEVDAPAPTTTPAPQRVDVRGKRKRRTIRQIEDNE